MGKIIRPFFKDEMSKNFRFYKNEVDVKDINEHIKNILNTFQDNKPIENYNDVLYSYEYLNNFYNTYKMLFKRNEIIINSLLQYLVQYRIKDDEYIIHKTLANKLINKHDTFINKLCDLIDSNETVLKRDEVDEIKFKLVDTTLPLSEDFREYSFDARLLKLSHIDIVMMFKHYKTRISDGSNFDNLFKVSQVINILRNTYNNYKELNSIEDEDLECISFFLNNDNISVLINTLDEMSVFVSKLINEMNYQLNFYEDTVNSLRKFKELLNKENIHDEEIDKLVENYRKFSLEEIRKREKRFNSINNTISNILDEFPNDFGFNSFLTNNYFRDTFNEITYVVDFNNESPIISRARNIKLYSMNESVDSFVKPYTVSIGNMYGGNLKKELLCIRNTYLSLTGDENPKNKYIEAPVHYTLNMTLNPFFVNNVYVEMDYSDFEEHIPEILNELKKYYNEEDFDIIRNEAIHDYVNSKKITIPTSFLQYLIESEDEELYFLLELICSSNLMISTLFSSNKVSPMIRYEKEYLNTLEYFYHYDKNNFSDKEEIDLCKEYYNIEKPQFELPREFKLKSFIKKDKKIETYTLLNDIISCSGRILYDKEKGYQLYKEPEFQIPEEIIYEMYHDDVFNERNVKSNILKSFDYLNEVNKVEEEYLEEDEEEIITDECSCNDCNCKKVNTNKVAKPEILYIDRLKRGDTLNINGVLVVCDISPEK